MQYAPRSLTSYREHSVHNTFVVSYSNEESRHNTVLTRTKCAYISVYMCTFYHHLFFITGTTQKISTKKDQDSVTQGTAPVYLQHERISLHTPQPQYIIFVPQNLYSTFSPLFSSGQEFPSLRRRGIKDVSSRLTN